MSDGDEDLPSLELTGTDKRAAIVRSLVGTCPFLGAAFVELVNVTIPNQREERLVAFVQRLEERVHTLEAEDLATKFAASENIDLVEDGMFQAIRSLSAERTRQIADLVANGLTRDDVEYHHKKKLLQIFGELNDLEVLILKSLDDSAADRREFLERHKDAIIGPVATMGASREVVARSIFHQAARAQLERLGLSQPRGSGWDLSPLGRLLLRYLETDELRSE